MYEARKICNFLLANFDAVEFDLTNLRINKLLFFIQAGSLRLLPEGLIRNHFEAWQFGPVVRPVFDSFKIYKEGPIRGPAQYLDYASGTRIPVPYDDIREDHLRIITQEFNNYSRFTTGQLVSLSHEPNGPWDIVYRAHLADPTTSPRIPNQLIRRHFAGEEKSTVRH
ncbi:putative phage-associated protein [Bradyrhizobium huanghuaihaiense]|uniref:Putative phage-associated protein n=1 Tax=Bradyrhizobium huanghuaihaiense TaxID=990078 RepID=A0A562QNL2_9BRAD|nr:type II toxin-antitoxin system antitoxin SocA domain-containing protein [Bradyrhizobium huanghuaihaiense]TWI58285.1 putative phage-associated protein [Bradyrhizobium huanghuaihaiense]